MYDFHIAVMKEVPGEVVTIEDIIKTQGRGTWMMEKIGTAS